MLKNIPFAVLYIFIFIICSYKAVAAPYIVAVVNGKYVILNTDIELKSNFLKIISLNQKFTRDEIMQNIITNYLILEDAKKFKITLSNEEFNNGLESLLKNKNISESQLFKEANNYGISKNTFNKLLKDELLAEKTKQSISISLASVSNAEITSEINKFLTLNGKNEILLAEITVNSEEQANEIYPNINSYNFSEYAKQYSSTYIDKTKGEIGWVPEIYLPKEVYEAINQSGINKPTKIIKIDNKYKIYMVKGIRPLLQINSINPEHIEKIEQFAKQKIMFEKAQAAQEEYLQELYKKASITFY